MPNLRDMGRQGRRWFSKSGPTIYAEWVSGECRMHRKREQLLLEGKLVRECLHRLILVLNVSGYFCSITYI